MSLQRPEVLGAALMPVHSQEVINLVALAMRHPVHWGAFVCFGAGERFHPILPGRVTSIP